MIKKILLTVFLVLVQTVVFGATYTFNGTTNSDWNNGANWSGGIVAPTAPGNGDIIIINANVNVGSITIGNGATLNVNVPATLTVGIVGTSATTRVVDFQNGSIVYVNSGSTLVVYGLMNNSNNSNGVVFNGTVSVYGNVTGGNSSVITGSGTLDSTGTITTADGGKPGTVFGSTGDCQTGPCSSSTSCPSFTGSISSSQTICPNTIPTTLTSSTTAFSPIPTDHQWQSSTTSGIGFADILVNGKYATYVFPSALTQTTYYRLKIKSTCTVVTTPVTITVNQLPQGSLTANGPFCATGAGQLTWTATAGTGPFTVVYNDGVANRTVSGVVSGTAFATFTTPVVSTTTYTLVSVTSANTCVRTTGFTGALATITVNPTPAITNMTATSCSAGSFTATPVDGTNGIVPAGTTYTWSVPVVAGITGTAAGTNAANISGTLTNTTNAAIVVVYSVTPSGTCGGSTFTVTVTVSPALVGGSIAGSASVCPGTNSTALTLSGYTGSITSWESSLDNFATAGTSIANTTISQTATNLTVTTYYRVVITSGSCTANSATATVTVNTVTKTWDGVPPSSWFVNGVPTPDAPTINDIVIISEDFNTSSLNGGDLNAGCLTINTGKTLTITAGKNVTIQNDLTVNADATLDILDKGSLVMVNDLGKVTNTGTGTTKVHRFTTPFKLYDYVYWSTPVSATNIADTFQPIGWNTNRAYEYIPGSDWSFASTMSPGKGYIIMVPTPTSGPGTNNPSEVIFSGKVNNGVHKITGVIPDSSYLLGNPYPSAINADVFLDANAGVLDGTLYFWTHNTAIQLASNIAVGNAGSGAYAFTSDDYASYNRTGGVATAAAKSSGLNTSIPTGKIASGQGFFASSNTPIVGPNEIVYNNSMRLAGTTSLDNKTGVNEQFFRTSATAKAKTASALEKHRIWLDLKNSQGAFKQTLLGYISGATNDYDTRFDGESYDGNDFVDFYSINQDKNLTIQGRAVPFDENDTVLLGFKTTIAGSFTINIGQVDGLLTNQAVYLEDKVTNTLTNLKTGDYTFTTAMGTFDDRFVLRYTDKTLGLNDTDKADGILVFYSNNYKTLIIKNNVMDATVNSVVLFNTTGQRMANFDIKDSGQTNLQIPIKNIPSGIYIVKVKTTKGESSKKVIVN